MTTTDTTITGTARAIAARIESDCSIIIPRATLMELVQMVQAVVDDYVVAEARRGADICRGRADLWRTTSQASGPSSAGREEARARANEADYLAEALLEGRLRG